MAEHTEAFLFDDESTAEIDGWVAKYPPGRQASAVLPALYAVQNQMRRQSGIAWVPRPAMDAVAKRLAMPPIRVYEVATFYLMFNTKPIGRYHLQICTTTPCWLRGSDEVVAACKRVTGIQHWKETSADGLFTMTEVECLGACVNAPMMQIDDEYYEDLDGESTAAVAGGVAARRGVAEAGFDDRPADLGASWRPDHAARSAFDATGSGGVGQCCTIVIVSSPTCMACTTGGWTARAGAAIGMVPRPSWRAAVRRSSTR